MATKNSTSQPRLLDIIELLFNDVVQGYKPMQIARHVQTVPSNVTRDMETLKKAGWAIFDEDTGCWRLHHRISQQAVKIYAAADRHRTQLEEAISRHTRSAD